VEEGSSQRETLTGPWQAIVWSHLFVLLSKSCVHVAYWRPFLPFPLRLHPFLSLSPCSVSDCVGWLEWRRFRVVQWWTFSFVKVEALFLPKSSQTDFLFSLLAPRVKGQCAPNKERKTVNGHAKSHTQINSHVLLTGSVLS